MHGGKHFLSHRYEFVGEMTGIGLRVSLLLFIFLPTITSWPPDKILTLRSIDLSPQKLAILPRSSKQEGQGVPTCTNFGKWVLESSQESMVGFWRGVISHLECERGLKDFHLCVLPESELRTKVDMLSELGLTDDEISQSPFLVIVTHGLPRFGPGKYPVCMTCDMGARIDSGVWGIQKENACEDFAEIISSDAFIEGGDELSRCCFDAKARDMYVVCPRAHKERLSELDDREMHSFWSSLARMLKAVDGDEMRRVGFLVYIPACVQDKKAYIIEHMDFCVVCIVHICIHIHAQTYTR